MPVILSGSLSAFPLAELLPFLAKRQGTLLIDGDGNKAQIALRGGVAVWAESASANDPVEVALEASRWKRAAFSFVDELLVPATESEKSIAIEQIVVRLRESGSFAPEATFRVIDDPALQDALALTSAELKLLIRVGMGRSFSDLIEGRDAAEVTESMRRFVEAGLVEVRKPAPPTTKIARPATIPTKTIAGPIVEAPRAASLTEEGPSGSAYALLAEEQSIGRDATNTISITDGSISGRHAVIRRTAAGFQLEDLGSRNGTFVNGERITAPQILVDNDIVRLGKVVFTFNLATPLTKGETTAH
jgi:predicted component of type VI protein secretion system